MLTFVRNGGVQLCVERVGSGGRHVLFLHGWISARRMWYDVVEHLDHGRFSCYLMDFRGCGLSDRPAEGHDLAGYASDARAVLESIGAPVVVAGHSMGAKVAQYVACDGPVNLEKLVLVAPGTAFSARTSARLREAALAPYGSREKIEAFQRAAMRADVSAQAVERIVEDALLAQREHWVGWYDRGRFVDFHERLARIAVPALCVAGAEDPLIPPIRVRREVAQSIAACLYVALRGAAHNLPIEAAHAVAGAIEQFGN